MLTIPQLVPKVPGRSLHRIGDARLERVGNGRPVDPIGRVPRPAILFVGPGGFVRHADPGRVDNRMLERLWILGRIDAGDVQYVEVPPIESKDVVEGPTHVVSANIGELFVSRAGPGG